jgi:hypothetical protein
MATNLEFIKSASGTSVASLDVTYCFSADYDVYYLTWSLNISGTAGYAQAYLLDSGGSTLTGTDYDYATLEMYANASFVEARATSQQFWRGIGAYQDDGKGYGFSAYIYNPFDSSSYTFVTSQSGSMVTANTVFMGNKNIGVYKQASSVYGIRLTNSTPTSYEYINASVYGVK